MARILVLEDEPFQRRVLVGALQMRGMGEAIAPTDWTEAVEALRSLVPGDIVVSDGYMWPDPEVPSSYITAREAQALCPAGVTFVVYSSLVKDFPGIGDARFVKNENPHELFAYIREILSRPTAGS